MQPVVEGGGDKVCSVLLDLQSIVQRDQQATGAPRVVVPRVAVGQLRQAAGRAEGEYLLAEGSRYTFEFDGNLAPQAVVGVYRVLDARVDSSRFRDVLDRDRLSRWRGGWRH